MGIIISKCKSLTSVIEIYDVHVIDMYYNDRS